MAKFKEGSVVKVVTPHKAVYNRVGVVIDYITKDRLSVDFGKPIGAIAINECDLEFVGVTADKDVFLEKLHDPTFLRTIRIIDSVKPNPIIPKPIIPSAGYGNCLTDPNVDYEALSEEPVYYEFIDIGKALNKLKEYEYTTVTKPPATTVSHNQFADLVSWVLRFVEASIIEHRTLHGLDPMWSYTAAERTTSINCIKHAIQDILKI